jgi:hypothetical protein
MRNRLTVEMTFRWVLEMKGSDVNWRELLTEEIEYGYAVADKVIALVDDDELEWKPATGDNWMKTGQLLKHIAMCCGRTFKGFVTDDWGLPAGIDPKDMKPEDMLPRAEALPAIESVAAARKELADDKQLTLDMLARAPTKTSTTNRLRLPGTPGQ